MEPQAFKLRLQHLDDNIKQDLELLKEYEDELRYEDDPRRKAKYRRAIDDLRQSATNHQRELDELRSLAAGDQSKDLVPVEVLMQQIDQKLDALLAGQQAIATGLIVLRQTVLEYYREGQRAVVAAIINRLDQSQLETVQTVLKAVESNRLPEAEMKQLLGETQQALASLSRQNINFPDQDKVETALSDTTLEAKHKIKFAIPIVPMILEYEAEIELGSGVSLGETWRELKKKLWG